VSDKFYKFHFKNDKVEEAVSFHVNLDSFTEAMNFAYDKLDELNKNASGYRIIGIYEILYSLGATVPRELN
tara:strand:+ start:291 stop:503 length:213 start_codon:yes stop_codon:yes gene_type:complete